MKAQGREGYGEMQEPKEPRAGVCWVRGRDAKGAAEPGRGQLMSATWLQVTKDQICIFKEDSASGLSRAQNGQVVGLLQVRCEKMVSGGRRWWRTSWM